MTASHPTGGRWPLAGPVLQQGLGACAEFSKRLATVPNRSAIKLHFTQYCTFYAVCVLYVPVTTQRSNQATLKARPGLKPASLVQIK